MKKYKSYPRKPFKVKEGRVLFYLEHGSSKVPIGDAELQALLNSAFFMGYEVAESDGIKRAQPFMDKLGL